MSSGINSVLVKFISKRILKLSATISIGMLIAFYSLNLEQFYNIGRTAILLTLGLTLTYIYINDILSFEDIPAFIIAVVLFLIMYVYSIRLVDSLLTNKILELIVVVALTLFSIKVFLSNSIKMTHYIQNKLFS